MSNAYSSTIMRPAPPASWSAASAGARSAADPNGPLDRFIQEFEERWRRGERPAVEEYLHRHPELNDQPAAVVELLYEEICQRRQSGETVSEEQIAARFPQLRSQLEMLWDCDRLLEDNSAEPSFPAVGETLGDFLFLAELGRGAHGRVFLATQPSLAHRSIVLKLAPPHGSEHLCLARLQHTHIVPLYSVTDFPERALRGICLPYFGGATLSRVLQTLEAVAPAQRKTAGILAAIQKVPADLPPSAAEGPRQNASAALHFLETATYEQAICWMGACLADGLHEAHERGLVHLDLKPSNVLWAGDGQPMLLDFHLAREPVAEGLAAPDWLGGTPGYMPPEQEAALDAVRRDMPISAAVDRRADIYALGRVLSEALAGALPPVGAGASDWLRRSNPLVSAGLADLIAKCLSAAPEDRYADAALLAADLRRHLNHLPLAAVKNRSLAERWNKWRRRRPHALLVLLLGIAACGAGLLVAVQVRKQFGQAEIALEEGRSLIAEHRYAEATSTLRQGLGLTEPMYRSSELSQQLEAELRMAERAQAAQELHQFIDRTRVLCSSDGLKVEELRQLESQARRFWNLRRWFVERITAPTPWELMRRRRMDVLDLAILWTGLRVRLADEKDKPAAHRRALEILTQAETLTGESGVLWHARRNHAVALKMEALAKQAEEEAAAAPPTSAWEYAAAGHALWEAGRLQEANAYFEQALRHEPQTLWVNFCYGRCAYQLGRWEDAAAAFTACVSLAPASAWCFYNRGQAWTRLGRPDRARNDFDRALSLDATLTQAVLDRGRLNLDERRWSEAADDFQNALDHGGDPAAAHFGLALVEAGQGRREAARTSLQRALQFDPQLPEALSLRESLDRPQ